MENTTKAVLKPEDLTQFKILGEVQISPDARSVYYDVSYIEREKNVYQGEIWQLELGQNYQPRKITGGLGRDSTPRLSPDGKKLAFLSDRNGGKKQLYLLELDKPGEARSLTGFQAGVNTAIWSPDNRHLVVLAETPDDMEKAKNWPKPESIEARRERETREQEEKRINGKTVTFDRVKMRSDGRRTLLPKDAHTQLWLIDSDSQKDEPRQLTSGPFNVGSPAFSPDGQKLVFSSTRDQHQLDFSCISDLWLIELFADKSEPQKLTESKGPAYNPAFSPDGSKIAYIGHTNPKDGSFLEIPRLWVLELGGQGRCLTATFDYPVANLLNTDVRVSSETALNWSADNSEVFFAACHKASLQLFRVAANGQGAPRPFNSAGQQTYNYSFAHQAGQMVYAATSPLDPGDVYIQDLKGGAAKQITFLNLDWLNKDKLYLAEPETILVPSKDGSVEIEGWLLKPPGFDASKKYPLILQVHGGPHTAYGHSFYLEFQILAAQGNLVLFTNPRGSVSYGYEFTAAIHNDWGHHDFDDVMAVIDYLIERGYVDPARLGITGGSYGGYMTNWAITQTDRFRAALTDRCVSNLMTMYTLSDISFGFVESEFEGNIWTNPRIWERSPMAHANKAKTPLLMLHSESDFRCPIEQAEEFFFALKRNNCEVELIRTPAEDHNLSRGGSPDHRLTRLHLISDWFGKKL